MPEEAHDAITGEILPPAADGGRLFPGAHTFSQFLTFLENGQLDADLAGEMKTLVSELNDNACSNGGKSKGSITLQIDLAVEGDAIFVSAKHKLKLPEDKRPRSIVWSTDDGRLTPHKPNQGQLFGVRDVGGRSGPARNV